MAGKIINKRFVIQSADIPGTKVSFNLCVDKELDGNQTLIYVELKRGSAIFYQGSDVFYKGRKLTCEFSFYGTNYPNEDAFLHILTQGIF